MGSEVPYEGLNRVPRASCGGHACNASTQETRPHSPCYRWAAWAAPKDLSPHLSENPSPEVVSFPSLTAHASSGAEPLLDFSHPVHCHAPGALSLRHEAPRYGVVNLGMSQMKFRVHASCWLRTTFKSEERKSSFKAYGNWQPVVSCRWETASMSLSVPICKMGVTSEVGEEAEFRIVSSEVRYFLSLTNGLGKHLVRMFLVHPEVESITRLPMNFPPSHNGDPMFNQPVARKKRGNTPGTAPLLCGRKWLRISCL